MSDNMEKIESQNEDSTDNDNDYHGDQSDQPKKSVGCTNGESLTRERLQRFLGICLLSMELNRLSNKLLC